MPYPLSRHDEIMQYTCSGLPTWLRWHFFTDESTSARYSFRRLVKKSLTICRQNMVQNVNQGDHSVPFRWPSFDTMSAIELEPTQPQFVCHANGTVNCIRRSVDAGGVECGVPQCQQAQEKAATATDIKQRGTNGHMWKQLFERADLNS